MNDFSEIENELRRLRPARPSPVFFERIEEALANCRAGASSGRQPRTVAGLPYSWLSLGGGLAAAAAALVLFAIVTMERRQGESEPIAEVTRTPKTGAMLDGIERSKAPNEFIPARTTQVVYNKRDEGLQFGDGLKQPLRRLRYQTHQTWQWRNPTTGASLRVSYPSEELVLIPVSGQ